MMQIVDCIVVEHDLPFVAVAALIGLFGAFTGASLISRAL